MDTTLKVKVPHEMNERERAEYNYSEAWKAVLDDPKNKEKLAAFEAANKALWEMQDAYHTAQKLLLERAERLRREEIDAQIMASMELRLIRDGNRIRFVSRH